jgi:hypothetical protein
MTSSYEELDDDTLVMALTREEPDELCVAVRFSGQRS